LGGRQAIWAVARLFGRSPGYLGGRQAIWAVARLFFSFQSTDLI
jgi:hypothetical protein